MASTLAYLEIQARRRGATLRAEMAAKRGGITRARRAYITAVCRVLTAETANTQRQPRAAGRFAPRQPIITTAADLFGVAP